MKGNNLSLQWLKHLKSDEDKEEFTKYLRNSSRIFQVLTKILEGKTKEITLEPDYSNPSWSHQQADRNGYNRAVKDIIKLIDI